MFSKFALIALSLVALSGQAQQSLYVAPLPRDGEVLVTFRLEQALSDDLRMKIHSGLTVSFVYKVDLKRSSAVWIDRTIGSAVVTATVRYDNLTRKYHLSRMLDGASDHAEVTDKEDIAWAWVTTQFERLPLFRGVPLESNGEYYVRVRAHTTPNNPSFVWPWSGNDVVGFAKFTFIR
jgi:hypothetical protein